MYIYVIASGGGHTGYAIAVVERLLSLRPSLSNKIVFITPRSDLWSVKRLYRRLGSGLDIEFVAKPRKPVESIYRLLANTPKAVIDSWKSIREPCIVLATGSNHSLYPVLVALVKRVKHVFTIEAIDRVYTFSKANMAMYKLFKATIFLHWIEQKRNYGNGLVVGPIVEKPLYKPRDQGYILVITGSMGHKKLIDLLLETSIEDVVVQTGRIDPQYILSRKPSWRAFRFDPDIDKWIAGASLVIGHQGLTIAEAAISYGKPVVLAYNPDLPQTSGLIDSIMLARKLNGYFIDPRRCDPQRLTSIIEHITTHRDLVGRRRYCEGAFVVAKALLNIIDVVCC